VRRIWVPPCASDTGAPLGSALWHYHQTLGHPRGFALTHPFYGQSYSEDRIRQALDNGRPQVSAHPEAQMLRRAAQDLADGKIVGWFQGRFEMGPRALGNRSILADPRRAEMRDHLERAGQEARRLPPVRSGRPARARIRVLRDRSARSLHDAGPARAP
jgi:carbamoyltransferase